MPITEGERNYVYPAVCTFEDDNTCKIIFPDLELELSSDGLLPGVDIARDMLALTLCNMEDDGVQIPFPSDSYQLQQEYPDSDVLLIQCDVDAYRRDLGEIDNDT